ncbi:MAG: hypothetical protein AAF386_06465 [Pseudomonadota bacterium]
MTRGGVWTLAVATGFVGLWLVYGIFVRLELQMPGADYLCDDGLRLWPAADGTCTMVSAGTDRVWRMLTGASTTYFLTFVVLPGTLILGALNTTQLPMHLAQGSYTVSLLLCLGAVFPIIPATANMNALMLANGLAALASMSASTKISETAKDAGRLVLAAAAMIALPFTALIAAIMHMVLYLNDPLFFVVAEHENHPTLYYLQTIYIWLENLI